MTPTERAQYNKEYRAKNRDLLNAKARRKYTRLKPKLSDSERAEKQRQKSRDYYHNHREDRILKQRAWADANREHLAAYKREYLAANPNTRLAHNFRVSIGNALKNLKGVGRVPRTVKALGISIQEFRLYIQEKFLDGMTWDNYGEWHLDHIKSLSSFDLTDENQFNEAGHYTNYQPLWAGDNIRKR